MKHAKLDLGNAGASLIISRGSSSTEMVKAGDRVFDVAQRKGGEALRFSPVRLGADDPHAIPLTPVPRPDAVNPMDQVDENIYIGDVRSANNENLLREHGITHIVNATEELPNFHPPPKFHYLKLNLKDNRSEDLLRVLEPTFQYISSVIRYNPRAKVLIHCHMGMSRSASLVIYYMMRRRGMTFDAALDKLKVLRPLVNPNVSYRAQLKGLRAV